MPSSRAHARTLVTPASLERPRDACCLPEMEGSGGYTARYRETKKAEVSMAKMTKDEAIDYCVNARLVENKTKGKAMKVADLLAMIEAHKLEVDADNASDDVRRVERGEDPLDERTIEQRAQHDLDVLEQAAREQLTPPTDADLDAIEANPEKLEVGFAEVAALSIAATDGLAALETPAERLARLKATVFVGVPNATKRRKAMERRIRKLERKLAQPSA